MVTAKELKAVLKTNKIHLHSYWDKKRLLDIT